jgi:hypothetical protein
MRDKDLEPNLSWRTCLIVTGVSFLFFYGVLMILDSSQLTIFLWIGIASLLSGLIGLFFKSKDGNDSVSGQ